MSYPADPNYRPMRDPEQEKITQLQAQVTALEDRLSRYQILNGEVVGPKERSLLEQEWEKVTALTADLAARTAERDEARGRRQECDIELARVVDECLKERREAEAARDAALSKLSVEQDRVVLHRQTIKEVSDARDAAVADRDAALAREQAAVGALRDCLPERAHMIDIGVHRPANFKVADLTVGQLRGIYAALRRTESAQEERDAAIARGAGVRRPLVTLDDVALLTCLRCRKSFEREDDKFRCVDCGAYLHRECAKAHFGTRVWPPTQACAVDAALRDERRRAEAAEQALAAMTAERDTAWERARKSWEDENSTIHAAWHAAADKAEEYIGLHGAERALRKEAEQQLAETRGENRRLREALKRIRPWLVCDATCLDCEEHAPCSTRDALSVVDAALASAKGEEVANG